MGSPFHLTMYSYTFRLGLPMQRVRNINLFYFFFVRVFHRNWELCHFVELMVVIIWVVPFQVTYMDNKMSHHLCR